jgi:hypothetical protein
VGTVEAAGKNRVQILDDRDVRPEAAGAVVAADVRLLSLSAKGGEKASITSEK